MVSKTNDFNLHAKLSQCLKYLNDSLWFYSSCKCLTLCIYMAIVFFPCLTFPLGRCEKKNRRTSPVLSKPWFSGLHWCPLLKGCFAMHESRFCKETSSWQCELGSLSTSFSFSFCKASEPGSALCSFSLAPGPGGILTYKAFAVLLLHVWNYFKT